MRGDTRPCPCVPLRRSHLPRRTPHPALRAIFSRKGRRAVEGSPIKDPPTIHRLTSRPQFLAAAKGVSLARGAVVVQRLDRADDDATLRVGFTATRKVGGAVVRNRCKRRLRQAARALVPELGVAGSDYVFIARQGTADRPWERLLDDVKSALTRLATQTDRPASGPATTVPISSDTPPQDRGPA